MDSEFYLNETLYGVTTCLNFWLYFSSKVISKSRQENNHKKNGFQTGFGIYLW